MSSYMLDAMKQMGVVFAVVALMVASALPALGQEAHATGLDRALQVAAQGLGTANGLANNPNADRTTGRARAAEAIAAALGRGNGNGNAYGRGRSVTVHDILAFGGSPSEIAGEHGQAVSAMVHAYNELRKQSR